ncbi:MAG: RsmE family RNA methyltransferase [candidate division Zixibacteria bacterium]|nr:RsmE family RNA methyltransferase [candidate division Zixibacteria bacterium]
MQEAFTYFYVSPQNVNNDEVIFSEEESTHITKVCRKSEGDEIYATDGLGNRYLLRISDNNEKKVIAEVLNTDMDINEPKLKLSLAVPWTKDPKLDLIITKCTELGVSKFVYYTADKSVVKKDDDKIEKKIERHKRLSISAVKQSLRCVVPEMRDIGSSHNFKRYLHFYESSYYADLNRDALPLDTALKGQLPKWLLLVIGPEAGFSREEKIILEENGALPISLGPRRLRFETAAIAFTSMALALLGELS